MRTVSKFLLLTILRSLVEPLRFHYLIQAGGVQAWESFEAASHFLFPAHDLAFDTISTITSTSKSHKMEDTPINTPERASTEDSNSKSPKYTLEQATQLHQVAAANYKHVLQKIRAVSNKERLPLADIYRGLNRASCTPAEFNLHVLFKHFNDIARANFVAHPSLSPDLNSLIFYYSFDKLHGFMFALDQSRNNLILAVMTLASKLVGKYDTKYDLSEHIWGKCLFAWVECMTTSSEFRISRCANNSSMRSAYLSMISHYLERGRKTVCS